MALKNPQQEILRQKLCELERFILKAIILERTKQRTEQLAAVTAQTTADTLYAIDHIADHAIHCWFEMNWPPEWPVQIIMEGIEDDETLTFPKGTAVDDTILKCIIDPIDGTREIMYDKRSAWILAGIAPQRFNANRLLDIEVAV